MSEATYGYFSADATRANQPALRTLAEDVRSVYPEVPAAGILGLRPDVVPSAATRPVHGLVGVKPALLELPEIAACIDVHESVHAFLGKTVTRDAIDEAAPGFNDFFARELVPAWINGNLTFEPSDHYVADKDWTGLMPNDWMGAYAITRQDVTETMRNFFSVVARNQISDPENQGDFYHPSPLFRSWEESLKEPLITPEAFQGREAWLAKVMLTGFEAGELLYGYYRDSQRLFPNKALWEWEEGLANYIATELTGVPLEAVQQAAPQDEAKLVLTRKIAATGVPAEQLAEEITDYDKFYRFLETNI